MSRPHEDLAAAHDRQDWAYLWAQALPLVRHAAQVVASEWRLPPEAVTEDLLQEGYLAARTAVERWNPLVSAFSTAVINGVKPSLRNHLSTELAGPVGSRRVRTLRRPYNDGIETPGPASFRDPAIQLAERERSHELLQAVARLRNPDQRAVVEAVMGRGLTLRAFAAARSISEDTTARWLRAALKNLRHLTKNAI